MKSLDDYKNIFTKELSNFSWKRFGLYAGIGCIILSLCIILFKGIFFFLIIIAALIAIIYLIRKEREDKN